MVLFKVLAGPMATDHLTGICPLRSYYRILLHKKEKTDMSPMSFESAYNEASKFIGEFH
jgi:hydroxymethylglutaryl-CoA lyase